jgi:thiamine pyrophosphate-dependent acetolactate synthase large subunit-like protein
MKRAEVIQALFQHIRDELVVCANGMIGREAYVSRDREGSFYMIGSMGLASSIGLGIALARPDRRVLVLDGDGNVLMALGTLAQVGHLQPKNYLHVCLDNETYDSTGGQKTISDKVQLHHVARASGYARSVRVTSWEELETLFPEYLKAPGPSFMLVKVEPGNVPGIARVAHAPEEITRRFLRACREGA